MGTSAPYWSATGSHSSCHTKAAPNCLNAGSAPTNSSRMMAPSSTSTRMPARRHAHSNSASAAEEDKPRRLGAPAATGVGRVLAAWDKVGVLFWNAVGRHGRDACPAVAEPVSGPYIGSGWPFGPLTSARTAARTACWTLAGSGMYSSSWARLPPLA